MKATDHVSDLALAYSDCWSPLTLAPQGNAFNWEKCAEKPIAIPLGHRSAGFATSKPAGSFVPSLSGNR